MSSLVHQGGWVKREVEAARGTDGDTIVACGMSWGVEVACGASWGTVAVHGAGVDFGVARGTGWDAGVARGVPIISEVPTIEEGYVGTLKTRYPAYKFQVKTKGEACKSHAPACPQPQHEPHSPGPPRVLRL
jgi:hypothetical protein